MQSLFELGYVISLVDHMTGPLKAIEGQISHLNETVKRTASWREAGQNMAMVGAGALAMGTAAALALKSTIDPAMAMQGELAHVSTAMDDGAAKAAHLAEVHGVVNDVAAQSVISNVELAESYYLARSNMLGHADALDVVRHATELVEGTTQNAADAQAAMGETTRTVTALMVNLGGSAEYWTDKMARLQTQFAFRNIGELTGALSYATPLIKGMQLDADQAFAALAGLSAAGLYGERAGTAFREFVSKLGTGKKLHDYAVENSQGALDIIKTLENLHAHLAGMAPLQQGQFLKELGFGLRDIVGVETLIDKTKQLYAIAADAQHASGAAADAARVRTAALDEQFAIFWNNVTLLRETIGEALLPTLNQLVPALTAIVRGFNNFAEAHPWVVKLGVAFTALFSAASIVAGGLLVFGGAGLIAASYLPMLRIGLVAGSDAFAGLATLAEVATGAVTTFLLTNPVGWALLAVGSLGLVYHYWDSIKAGAQSVYDWFTGHQELPPIRQAYIGGHFVDEGNRDRLAALGRMPVTIPAPVPAAGWFERTLAWIQSVDWASAGATIAHGIGYGVGAAMVGVAVAMTAPFLAVPALIGAALAGAVGIFYRYGGQIVSAIGAGFAAAWHLTAWINTKLNEFEDRTAQLMDALVPAMHAAGVAMLKALGQGITDGLMWPVHAAEAVAARIKDLFVGHSPPPEGPLHELGRVRIVETIAEMMSPGPVVAAARRVAAAAALAIPLTIAPALAATGPLGGSPAQYGPVSAPAAVAAAPTVTLPAFPVPPAPANPVWTTPELPPFAPVVNVAAAASPAGPPTWTMPPFPAPAAPMVNVAAPAPIMQSMPVPGVVQPFVVPAMPVPYRLPEAAAAAATFEPPSVTVPAFVLPEIALPMPALPTLPAMPAISVPTVTTPPIAAPVVRSGAVLPPPEGRRGNTSIELTYAPVIHAGAGTDKAEIEKLLEEHSRDLVDRLASAQRRAERTEY